MFSNVTKVTYTDYLCNTALDLHGPAINAYTYPFFTCSIKNLFQNIFSRQVYMHVNCIIQGFVDVKQPFNPPIGIMYPYV